MLPEGPRLSPGALQPRWWPTWAVVAILALLGRLPYAARLALGRGLGGALCTLMRRRRRIAESNIALCFPALACRQRRRLLHAHFQELGIAVFETAAAWTLPLRALERLACIGGLEHIEAARHRGRGAIVVSAHLTCINMALQLLSCRQTGYAIYRPSKNPVLDYVICRGRGRQGARMFSRDEMRTMLRALRSNQPVWFSPDQDHGRGHSEFVRFFGQPAATVTTTARIAARTGAAVLPLLYRRLAGARGYELQVLPPLSDFPGDDHVAATRRLNEIFERQIRLEPAQYLWVHRRFKTRPEGLDPVYEGARQGPRPRD